ncbi:MAG TPA: sensor histidine kinase [Bryobacteraceae bacterium]
MATSPRNRPFRQSTGRVLLTGLGVVLVLLVALGLYAARSLASVTRAGTLNARQYFQQSERLDRVHLQLSAATGAVRDYLLESDPTKLSTHREEARRSWSQAVQSIEDYRGVAFAERRPLIDRLASEVASYWAVADHGLGMTGFQRSDAGVSLLIGLVPLREQFLATIAEIGARDRVDLRSAAASTARFAQAAEKRLWGAVALTVMLSLLVAGTTVRYLMRLEKIAAAQYEASVNAGMELEKLSRRLLTLQEDERRRIARELHDDYGQRMASVLFELSAASERADATPDLMAAIQKVEEHLGNVARDLQQLSRSLHSAVLDKIGLEAAIRSDCNSLRQRNNWDVDCQSVNVPKRLPEPVSLAAYRVFQEALQNALKHSHTNRLEILLKIEDRNLVLRIKDYGVGFDARSANQTGSLGLLSMRERARMVGGTVTIHSEIGKGTEVEARLPVSS